MLNQNRKPRTWVERDPIEEARLHARSIFQTLKELETARAINPGEEDYYDAEIRDVAAALFNANQRIAAMQARRAS